MEKFENLVGKKFGKLTVLKRVENDKYQRTKWLCKCDCGNEVIVSANQLKRGKTKSCGCLRIEMQLKSHTKHGLSKSRIFKIYGGMKKRCYCKTCHNYSIYGGRGIVLCEDWQLFENFYKWAINNGYNDNLTIDRIDVNGNYEPNNCRWVTQQIQARNTRTNKFLTYNGETHCYAEWEELLGLSKGRVWDRLNRGWSIEKVLSPITRGKRNG